MFLKSTIKCLYVCCIVHAGLCVSSYMSVFKLVCWSKPSGAGEGKVARHGAHHNNL